MRQVCVALALYGVLSLLFFGLPVLDHPGTDLISLEEIEPSAYHWWLAWWPDAILDGRNPFFTDFIYAPDMVNMTWVTSIPALALVFAPVTLLFGPVAAYNLVTLSAPVLSALAAFVLCRHLTRSFWPSIAGGYVFGFAPFMLIMLAGAPSHSFTALIPVAVYLVVRRVDGTLQGWRFVVLLALTLAGQFLIAVEVFAVLTVFGGMVGLAAYLLVPERRDALRRSIGPVALAYVGAVLLVSPYLWYMLFEPYLEPTHAIPVEHSSDLLSFVVPTSIVELGSGLFPSLEAKLGGAIPVAGGGGSLAYLGLPLVAVVVLFAREGWRDPRRRFLVLAAALLAVLSLGPRLWVGGSDLVPAPEKAFAVLPFLEHALPSRFPIYTALAVAVIFALWLAGRPARWKWLVAAAAIVFILPNFGAGFWSSTTHEPPFFKDKLYEGVLTEDDIVFTVPTIGPSVRWHAQAGMPFRLGNGYIGRVPDELRRFYPVINGRGPLPKQATRRFFRHRRVSVVLIAAAPRERPRWRRRLEVLGVKPRSIGGVLVYRLAPPGHTPSFGG